jgi:outer membrane protein assembly factor BamB
LNSRTLELGRCWLAGASVLLALPIAANGDSGDWPTFRGAARTAVAPDTGLLSSWPADGPKLLWETTGMGRGYSSPAIADGKIFTMGDGLSTVEDKDEYLICINQADGSELWRSKTGPAWSDGQESWQSSRSTPTIDGNHVYVLTAHGVLIKFTTDGKEVWRKDLKEDFGGKKADDWGYSESVLVDGNRLICTPGGEENTVVALNKDSGSVEWGCAWPDDRGAGHSSAVISQVGGKKVYVQVTGSGVMGVGADDGKLLWTYEIPRTTAVIPTPIVRDDLVFFSVGYGTGGALLRQVPSSDGVQIEEVYPLSGSLQNKHGGVVLIGDHVYGDSGDSGSPFCADLMTGEIQWKARDVSGSKSACVAAADGHLYFRYADGTMTLVEATPTEFKEVGSFQVPGSGERPSWAHPVIADGKLYLREGDKLLCYALR